ncbi:MAG: class A beta-lactamase-related serine hydrolase [Asticcacaulis sp.]
MFWTRRAVMGAGAAIMLTPKPARAATPSPDFSYLEDRLRQRVEAGYFSGIGLQIGRGEAVLHEAYFGDGGPSRVLHVASMGKWVAAATITAVVDAGRLDWSDKARAYIPELTDLKGEATLSQLLSHTAGYPDYQPSGARRDDYQSLEEAVGHIVGLPAVARPGEVFQYGGLAMQVAGRMAEIADGRDFNAIFNARIAQPLGMTRSGFSPVSEEPGFNPMLGGGFFTCAPDYGRFLAMMSQGGRFGGRQVLTARSVRTMEASHTDGVRITKDDFVEPARGLSRSDIYGLGQWREEVDRNGQPTLLSSPGWAGAYGWVDRAANLWGVVLAKADVPAAQRDGYNTFLGSTVYAPMVRNAFADTRTTGARRGTVDLPGARLYYEEAGQGEPLILIHGHSLDRRMWDDQWQVFARRYRVIRYDLRGYGRSSLPDEASPFLHAEDLKALMDHLGIERARLAGLSLGGFVATDFLALYPHRVVKAVVAGANLYDMPGPHTPWTKEGIERRRTEIAALKKEGQTAFKRRWYAQLVDNAGAGRERLRAPLWAMIDEWQMWQPLHIEPRLLLGRSAKPHLLAAKPQAPVLILRGDRERAGFSLTDLVRAQVHVIPDCGHLSNMDRPAAFNRAVLSFLR